LDIAPPPPPPIFPSDTDPAVIAAQFPQYPRLVHNIGSDGYERWAITPEFIDRYVTFQDAIVYAGSCFSLDDRFNPRGLAWVIS
jgi:hypothetical protein